MFELVRKRIVSHRADKEVRRERQRQDFRVRLFAD
jgi:hypothetical protein